MPFYKYNRVQDLDASKDNWILRVRAQSIWKRITRKTGELRGYNIIFFDDYSVRIHAFITAQIVAQFEADLLEGQIYVVQKFKVKEYNGDETNRAVRADKHIFFTSETKLLKDETDSLRIPTHSFDLFHLGEIDAMKKDNRFLADVVAVIENVEEKAVYTKETVEKSHVALTISDGKTTINVTFFNQFGDSFLEAYKKIEERPVIIVISCAKISEWKDVPYLTNFPATRFYLNLEHQAVNVLKESHASPNFYIMDIDDDEEVPTMTIAEIRKLDETFSQKNISCQVTVKKFDEKMGWYAPFCIQCDKDLKLVNETFQCCGRTLSYPDKRFRLYSLCSDKTGAIPIVWPDDQISRLTGKMVYEIDAEETEGDGVPKIPDILKTFEKKVYLITLLLSKENLKQGSNIYTASNISKPLEMSDSHSPNKQNISVSDEMQISNQTTDKEMVSKISTPPTENSTNRTRARMNIDPVEIPKLKIIKTEKLRKWRWKTLEDDTLLLWGNTFGIVCLCNHIKYC